jgi:hypothetical protein
LYIRAMPPSDTPLQTSARDEDLRTLSKRVFGNADRLPVAIAVARSEEGIVCATDIGWEASISPARAGAQLRAFADLGLVAALPVEPGRKRWYWRQPSPFWETCIALADRESDPPASPQPAPVSQVAPAIQVPAAQLSVAAEAFAQKKKQDESLFRLRYWCFIAATVLFVLICASATYGLVTQAPEDSWTARVSATTLLVQAGAIVRIAWRALFDRPRSELSSFAHPRE